MNDLQDTERGRQAAELLAHPLLKQALAAIEAEVVSQWGQCPARDHDGKEALWQLFKTAQKFRGVLSGYVESGKFAADKLRKFDEDEGRIRKLLRRA